MKEISRRDVLGRLPQFRNLIPGRRLRGSAYSLRRSQNENSESDQNRCKEFLCLHDAQKMQNVIRY